VNPAINISVVLYILVHINVPTLTHLLCAFFFFVVLSLFRLYDMCLNGSMRPACYGFETTAGAVDGRRRVERRVGERNRYDIITIIIITWHVPRRRWRDGGNAISLVVDLICIHRSRRYATVVVVARCRRRRRRRRQSLRTETERIVFTVQKEKSTRPVFLVVYVDEAFIVSWNFLRHVTEHFSKPNPTPISPHLTRPNTTRLAIYNIRALSQN